MSLHVENLTTVTWVAYLWVFWPWRSPRRVRGTWRRRERRRRGRRGRWWARRGRCRAARGRRTGASWPWCGSAPGWRCGAGWRGAPTRSDRARPATSRPRSPHCNHTARTSWQKTFMQHQFLPDWFAMNSSQHQTAVYPSAVSWIWGNGWKLQPTPIACRSPLWSSKWPCLIPTDRILKAARALNLPQTPHLSMSTTRTNTLSRTPSNTKGTRLILPWNNWGPKLAKSFEVWKVKTTEISGAPLSTSKVPLTGPSGASAVVKVHVCEWEVQIQIFMILQADYHMQTCILERTSWHSLTCNPALNL